MYLMAMSFFFFLTTSLYAADPFADLFSHHLYPKADEKDSTIEQLLIPIGESPSLYNLKKFNSDSVCIILKEDDPYRRRSLFARMFGPKKAPIAESTSCIDINESIVESIFKGDITGREVHFIHANWFLLELKKKMKEQNAIFPARLNSMINCYSNILFYSDYKSLRGHECTYNLALEGIMLAKQKYHKAYTKDTELFNDIESILGACGAIFSEKAPEERRSLESLDRVIILIKTFRTKRIETGLPFMSIVNVNEFAKIIEKYK